MRISSLVSVVIVLVMVSGAFSVLVSNTSANQGGRDSYGYRWTDSKAPVPSVAFNWVEINATGTRTSLSGNYDVVGPLSIGFDFDFYGNSYSQFYVTTSGFINFGYGSYETSNYQIPYEYDTNNMIAPYWDYLSNNAGSIYYQTVGSSPNRQLVVEWENVTRSYYGDLMTFEVILNETGDIWLQYLHLGSETGGSATVGIENMYGEIGTQYSYNTYGVLGDNLAILFSRGPIMFGPSQTKTDMPGTAVEYYLNVTNLQPFGDSFALVNTSAQGWALGLYDEFMAPLTDTDGDTIVDTGTMAGYTKKQLIATVSIPSAPTAPYENTVINATSFANSSNLWQCILTTVVMSAWFTPPHSDSAVDSDSDGKYNYMSLSLSVEVFKTDSYWFYADLYTPLGYAVASDSVYQYFVPGSHTVTVMFHGWNIYETGEDGPYRAEVYFRNSSWTVVDTDTHYTASYPYSDFMLVPGALTPPYSDSSLDTDSDGLYDEMTFYIPVTVNYARSFTIEFGLWDQSYSHYIGYRSSTASLNPGPNTMQVTYTAWEITTSGATGQLVGQIYLYVQEGSDYVDLDYDYYYTTTFDVSDYDRPEVIFRAPHDHMAINTDGDSYWNWFVTLVNVNVSVEGDYSITGNLIDLAYGELDTVTNTTHLTVGDHVVWLMFPGWPIRYDGLYPHTVELSVMMGPTELDTDEYTISDWYNYYHNDFEEAPAMFQSPHTSGVLDTNGDALYEYLIVNATVNVDEPGTFVVQGELYRYSWAVIETVTNTTYLTAGVHIVELIYPGWTIRASGYNGPYTVDLTLLDQDARTMSTASVTTASFTYDQFQTDPAAFGSPHEAYVEDTDSDGDYDGLFVNVTVVVDSPGLFLVQGILYDPSWNPLVSAGKWADLGTGTHVVQIAFPAWMINIHGDDGTFYVELYLYDASMNYLDDDWLSTSSYMNETFDLTVPLINSIWADTAPTMDGAMSAGEWTGAAAVDLTGTDTRNAVSAKLLVMNDATNLYIAYDAYGDMFENSNDLSTISFDTGNDGVRTDGHEDSFLLSGSSTSGQHLVFSSTFSSWTSHCSPFDTAAAEHATLAGNAGFGPSDGHAVDHRIYEYSIPLALLDIAPGDVIGFLGRNWGNYGLYDSSNGTASSWPVWFPSAPSMSQYGDLHLAAQAIPIPPPVTTASASGASGSAGWYVSQVNVTLSATGGLGGVNYTQYSLDGGSWTTYSTMIPVTADGTHTLEFRSVDIASQVEGTKTLTVKMDTVAPTSAAAVSGSWFWVNATDATSGISSIKFRIDDGAWTTYAGKVNITDTGTHVVEYYAVDRAGNTEDTKSVTIKVKNPSSGLGISSGTLMLIGLVVAAIAAAVIVLMLLMKRKKGQAPMTYAPVQPEMQPPGPPQ
jgi:hypothetical protein